MDKQSIQEKIENILRKSGVEIRTCDEDNGRIVFVVEFDAKQYLKGLKNIIIGFGYIPSDQRLVVIKPRLYVFDNEDESLKLDIVNKINDTIVGKVTLQNSDNSLQYVYDIIAPLEFITEQLVETIKLDITVAIATLVELLLENTKHEE